MKVFIGCDHAGFSLKQYLISKLEIEGHEVVDCGTKSEESCDYPVYGELTGREVVKNKGLGILICGSGIGIGIAANKVLGVRAAMVSDVTGARLSREHSDANIVSIGARLVGPEVALDICKTFLSGVFQGGRHLKRVSMLSEIERKK